MQLLIDEIIEHGHVFNLRRSSAVSDLRSTIRSLFGDLQTAGIDYVLVGGVALLAYVEGRNTQDIDLIVHPWEINKLEWQAAIQDRDFGAAIYNGVQVDLLLTSNPLFAHVARHERTTITFNDQSIPCVTREGLVLLKLYALPSLYRQNNLGRAALFETDIQMLLHGASINTEQLLESLRQYLPEHDVAELDRILSELRQRKRFSKNG